MSGDDAKRATWLNLAEQAELIDREVDGSDPGCHGVREQISDLRGLACRAREGHVEAEILEHERIAVQVELIPLARAETLWTSLQPSSSVKGAAETSKCVTIARSSSASAGGGAEGRECHEAFLGTRFHQGRHRHGAEAEGRALLAEAGERRLQVVLRAEAMANGASASHGRHRYAAAPSTLARAGVPAGHGRSRDDKPLAAS